MNKLFEVTWTANGSKTINVDYVEATTKMEAQGFIRRRELPNGGVKDISTKQVEKVA